MKGKDGRGGTGGKLEAEQGGKDMGEGGGISPPRPRSFVKVVAYALGCLSLTGFNSCWRKAPQIQ